MEVNLTPVSHKELIDLFFKRIDCFVFPSRGEGFGLPPMEAMATGVPAITTNWSALPEFMNNEVGWLIDAILSPAIDFTEQIYREYCGQWAEPDKNQLRKIMRYCYEHRNEVKKKGQKAAKYVKEHWTWEKQMSQYYQALKKIWLI